jgi:hypothetical protein
MKAILFLPKPETLQDVINHLQFGLATFRVSNTVMSRHLRDLGNINRHRKTGLELVAVTQRVYGDRRERHVILTARGANVARQMIAALRPWVLPKSPPETDAPGA